MDWRTGSNGCKDQRWRSVLIHFLCSSSGKFDWILSELAGDLQRAAGAAERIAQLLDTKANLPQHLGHRRPISLASVNSV